jgi:hypothetical protein
VYLGGGNDGKWLCCGVLNPDSNAWIGYLIDVETVYATINLFDRSGLVTNEMVITQNM